MIIIYLREVEVDHDKGLHSCLFILGGLRRRRKRRGWSCCPSGGRGGGDSGAEGRKGEADTLSVTLWKYVLISVRLFYFFI